ncbi:MAG TPA: PQQ-dependent sugar dehydrogenase [Candidatus Eisenbacteria bacterium]|nr:PQQ-dependent sugar dehydrogenase [Candidatus Eisenbacteria bacterium]
MSRFRVASLLMLLLTVHCSPARVQAQAPASPQPDPIRAPAEVETVARGLEHPWGIEFLPDGRMLVTERPGRLRIVSADGKLSAPLTGVPDVLAQSQGGLLDVTLSPTFAEDRLVYLSFSEPGTEGGRAGTAVARGRLGERGLDGTKVVWRQEPKVQSGQHWGSRIVFRGDGTMFITLGDRMNQRRRVQDLTSTIGKVVRIRPDGSIPDDNPFRGREGALPEIWSMGHRNIQAAAMEPGTDRLWTVEHGARGGDELNRPEAGKNYGWPVITYGVDYSGAKIGEGVAKEGMEQPVYYWDPVIAPSGMTFYTGDAYPGWKGSAFIGSLTPGQLVRLTLRDGKVEREERYLDELGERIRDVAQGPDGLLYVITDSDDGRVLRLRPRSAN